MEALPNDLGTAQKGRQVVVCHNDVGRGDSLVLVDAPDVEFVDRVDAGDLGDMSVI